jgi:hypothetical protein
VSHLPTTSSQARIGCAISTSIERRSRSPAVLSTAVDMPQMKTGRNSTPRMLPIRTAEREALVPVSKRCTWIGDSVAGETPCASRRALATLAP